MAGRYYPNYEFFVDWNGNGLYDHPASNVSGEVLTGEIRWGSNPIIDATRVKTATAEGRVRISNYDHRYDPNSQRLKVDEVFLRRRNACKLEVDGTILWSGACSPDQRATFGAQETLRWDLDSIYVDTVADTANELTINRYGTVAELAQAFALRSGIPFVAASDQPVGNVLFTGNWLTFLDQFGRFAGGWAIEQPSGGYIFQRYPDTVNLPLKANLDLSYGPLADESVFTSRAGHVRNTASVRSYVWVPITDEDGDTSEVVLEQLRYLPLAAYPAPCN